MTTPNEVTQTPETPEKKIAGWKETYKYLMQHFTAPCLGSTDADLRYLHELERLMSGAQVAVDAHRPDAAEVQKLDAAEAQEILRMWNIEARPHVRLLVNMMEIQLRSLQSLTPELGKGAAEEITRLKKKFGV